MNPWSNISVPTQDEEIALIDAFEHGLGRVPEETRKIRELITRFEVCHFKYREHLKKIKKAITHLKSGLVPNKIGKNHIQYGEGAWANDTTGKSLLGQQYVWSLQYWLGDIDKNAIHNKFGNNLGQDVTKWLGEKNEDKTRLVQLLLARLLWDWKSLNALQREGELKELEMQICRMDICHYAFPSILEKLLKGIGELNPIDKFEGCGSYNSNIKEFVEHELRQLGDLHKSLLCDKRLDKKDKIKIWLIACLIKTLKEQVDLANPVIKFNNHHADQWRHHEAN